MSEGPVIPDPIGAICLLDDKTRNAIYRFVVGRRTLVSRDTVADGLGIKRGTAVFHLDKMVAAGLLRATFQRAPEGRSGRPSKLYGRALSTVDVTLPARRYSLVGEVLLRAFQKRGKDSASNVIRDAAREAGTELGKRFAVIDREQDSTNQLRECLEANGYEPYITDAGDVELANCPFHALAQQFTEQVCDMNLALIEGMLTGTGAHGMQAELTPHEDRCCVRLAVPHVTVDNTGGKASKTLGAQG
jgi:predicted ArsR family transcriptional regulator